MTAHKGLTRVFDSKLLSAVPLLLAMTMAGAVQAAGAASDDLPYADSADEHFHPKGKPPSEHTLRIIREARETMPFAGILTTFEIGFEVLPGTAGVAGTVDLNPYEVPASSSTVRGE